MKFPSFLFSQFVSPVVSLESSQQQQERLEVSQPHPSRQRKITQNHISFILYPPKNVKTFDLALPLYSPTCVPINKDTGLH